MRALVRPKRGGAIRRDHDAGSPPHGRGQEDRSFGAHEPRRAHGLAGGSDDPRIVRRAGRRTLESTNEDRRASAAADDQEKLAVRTPEGDPVGARLRQERQRLPLDSQDGRLGRRLEGRRHNGRPSFERVGCHDGDPAEHHGAETREQRENDERGRRWARRRGKLHRLPGAERRAERIVDARALRGRGHRREGDLGDRRHASVERSDSVLSDEPGGDGCADADADRRAR